MVSVDLAQAIASSPFNRGLTAEEWLADPLHVLIERGGDFGLFEPEGEGLWNAHWLFRSRGRAALEAARDMFRELFDVRGAISVSGLTPIECRHGRMFNRWLGCRSQGIIETEHGPCEIFIMTAQMWKERG